MVQRAYGTLSRGQEELKKELTALGVEELEVIVRREREFRDSFITDYCNLMYK